MPGPSFGQGLNSRNFFTKISNFYSNQTSTDADGSSVHVNNEYRKRKSVQNPSVEACYDPVIGRERSCEFYCKQMNGVVDGIVYYDWEPPGANVSDVYLESGFEESCESRGMETITGTILMGRGLNGGDIASIPTLPEYYNMSYVGERSKYDLRQFFTSEASFLLVQSLDSSHQRFFYLKNLISDLYWNKVYGMGQMQGRVWDNMYYVNQTAVSIKLILKDAQELKNKIGSEFRTSPD